MLRMLDGVSVRIMEEASLIFQSKIFPVGEQLLHWKLWLVCPRHDFGDVDWKTRLELDFLPFPVVFVIITEREKECRPIRRHRDPY